MKRLINLLVLLTAFAAQAQSITEKDLLGKWEIARVIASDKVVDVETGRVDFSEQELDDIKAQGKDPEEHRKQVIASIKTMTMLFKPGNKVYVEIMGESKESDYAITTKEGVVFLTIKGKDSKITIKEGYLSLEPQTGSEPFTLVYKKVQ